MSFGRYVRGIRTGLWVQVLGGLDDGGWCFDWDGHVDLGRDGMYHDD